MDITKDIIGAAIEVHKELGPGLLETIYERALEYELHQRGFSVDRQQRVPIIYKGIDLTAGDSDDHALRYDLLVNDEVVLELKSVEELKKVHYKQLQTYLKLLDKKVGLLFNFNVYNLMGEGFKRVVNDFSD